MSFPREKNRLERPPAHGRRLVRLDPLRFRFDLCPPFSLARKKATVLPHCPHIYRRRKGIARQSTRQKIDKINVSMVFSHIFPQNHNFPYFPWDAQAIHAQDRKQNFYLRQNSVMRLDCPPQQEKRYRMSPSIPHYNPTYAISQRRSNPRTNPRSRSL